MKNKIKDLSLTTLVMLASLLVLLATNPWIVGYIDLALEWLGGKIVEYSKYGNIGATLTLVGAIFISIHQSKNTVNIPKKTSKTKKAGKFLE